MTYDFIIMNPDIKQQLIAHCNRELPNEACGYITGVNNELRTVYEMTNVDQSPVHFSFDPKEQFHVVKTSRKQNETPMVVYHSHPESPARLSDEDLRLLNDPNMIYMIVSLDDSMPEIKGYQIHEGSVNEVQIKIKEELNG